jgi:hypothetical protein
MVAVVDRVGRHGRGKSWANVTEGAGGGRLLIRGLAAVEDMVVMGRTNGMGRRRRSGDLRGSILAPVGDTARVRRDLRSKRSNSVLP